ncbi:MAG: hypothetical protein HYX48_06030 [Chlamydiales bacterium]|nr:hypothetical protein [Chlamydiales bacterium]
MHKLFVSKKKAKVFAFVLFLMGLLVLSLINDWWPGIMLVIGIPLAVRQFSLGRYYDMCVTLFVFLGVFFTALFSFSERYLLPVLFIVGAIYLSFREYIESTTPPEDESEEDLNEEIEEEQQEKK